MSLVLFALLTCGAAASGWVAGRTLRAASKTPPDPLALGALAVVDPLPGFFFGLGDALSRGGEEALLEGAYVLREEGAPLASIFVAAGPEGAPLVAAFPPPVKEVFWMERSVAPGALSGPLVLELGGALLELVRRLPVTIDLVGSGVPPLAREGILYEYRGDGERCALVLAAGGGGLVGLGTVCEQDALERFPGPFRAE